MRQQAKLAEVLKSPLADLQDELGMKTRTIEKNDAKIAEEEKAAKEWEQTYGGKLARAQLEAQAELDDAKKAYEDMPGAVSSQLSDVEAAAMRSMSEGMNDVDKEASFDAAKAKHELGLLQKSNSNFEANLQNRAKHSVDLATDEVNRVKLDQYRRFVQLDANDDQLADSIMELKHKSESMITDANEMSMRVAAAINKQVFVAEEKRNAAGKELGTLNARANAMAGNDASLSTASLAQLKQTLLQHGGEVSDEALEQLAASVEQHNVHEAAEVAKAEQLNDEVRKQLVAA